jgi:hypothetical protein
MKKLITIIAILSVSAIFAQTPRKMVYIPDYPKEYTIKFDREVDINQIRKIDGLEEVNPYRRRSNEIFVIGNFNEINVNYHQINIPETTVDNNNAEYIKTTKFKPQKTLQEILSDE